MYAGIQAVRKDKYSSCQDGQVFRLRMDIDNQEIKEYTIRKAKALWEIPEVPFFLPWATTDVRCTGLCSEIRALGFSIKRGKDR